MPYYRDNQQLMRDMSASSAAKDAEIAELRKTLNEWIDIAESQAIYDEFNKRYTHSFMSAGERMWVLLGLTDPYVPQEEFHSAVQRYKEKINA